MSKPKLQKPFVFQTMPKMARHLASEIYVGNNKKALKLIELFLKEVYQCGVVDGAVVTEKEHLQMESREKT